MTLYCICIEVSGWWQWKPEVGGLETNFMSGAYEGECLHVTMLMTLAVGCFLGYYYSWWCGGALQSIFLKEPVLCGFDVESFGAQYWSLPSKFRPGRVPSISQLSSTFALFDSPCCWVMFMSFMWSGRSKWWIQITDAWGRQEGLESFSQLCKLSCSSRGCSSTLAGQEQISLQPAGRSRWGSWENEKWNRKVKSLKEFGMVP